MGTYTPYVLLSIALFFGIIQSTFQKAGIGNDEQLGEGSAAAAYIIISLPLMILSNLCLLAVIGWSLFKLQVIPTLVIAVVGFVGWGFVWGLFLGHIRRTPTWYALQSWGIPLMLLARSITAGAVVWLALHLWGLEGSNL